MEAATPSRPDGVRFRPAPACMSLCSKPPFRPRSTSFWLSRHSSRVRTAPIDSATTPGLGIPLAVLRDGADAPPQASPVLLGARYCVAGRPARATRVGQDGPPSFAPLACPYDPDGYTCP